MGRPDARSVQASSGETGGPGFRCMKIWRPFTAKWSRRRMNDGVETVIEGCQCCLCLLIDGKQAVIERMPCGIGLAAIENRDTGIHRRLGIAIETDADTGHQ